MDILENFLNRLSGAEKKLFTSLTTPSLVQAYLDSIPYRVEDDNYCALSVFRDGKAHCFDGSLFAAAALRQIGLAPVVVQMLPFNDDDHMLAIYRCMGRFGAIGKSNFVGLRSREPVYASVRELIMSYFKDYYNLDGIFSLRGYTQPLNLSFFDHQDWISNDHCAALIYQRLQSTRKFRIVSLDIEASLAPVDPVSFRAGMVITNLDGAYKPGISPKKEFGF